MFFSISSMYISSLGFLMFLKCALIIMHEEMPYVVMFSFS